MTRIEGPVAAGDVGAGWLPDPVGGHELRYWDGSSWTEHVSDNGIETLAPLERSAIGQPASTAAAANGGDVSRPPFYADKRWWLAGGVAVVAIVALVISTSGGSSGNKVSVAQFCTDANQAAAAVNSRTNSNLAPLGKSELTSLAAQLRKLAGEAPAQIPGQTKADLTTQAVWMEKASINGVDAIDSATTADAQAAGQRFATWQDENCGSGSNNN